MGDLLSRFAGDPAVSTIITAVMASGIALWLLAAKWAHGDAERRTESELVGLAAAAWILLSTPLLLPLSLTAYLFVRPPEPVGDRRVRELTAAFVVESLVADACHGCGEPVDGSWRRCPNCSSWLAAPCADCGCWSAVELAACPWCGEIERTPPTAATAPVLVSLPAFAGGPVRPLPVRRAAVGARSSVSHERRAPSRPGHRRAPGVTHRRALDRSASGGGQGARPRS